MAELVSQLFSEYGLLTFVMIILFGFGCFGMFILYMQFKDKPRRQGLKYINTTIEKISNRLDSIETTMSDNKQTLENEIVLLRKHVEEKVNNDKSEITEKIATLESEYKKCHPNAKNEKERIKAIMEISPAIYSVFDTDMSNIGADHIFIGLYHNGTESLTGVPFMRFDVVCEKYYPIRHPYDVELSKEYKNEDLMIHNLLPTAMFQNEYVAFDLSEPDCKLIKIDHILYQRLKQKNVKHVIFAIFKDKISNMPHGFIGAYTFNKKLNIEKFMKMHKNISDIYNNMLLKEY